MLPVCYPVFLKTGTAQSPLVGAERHLFVSSFSSISTFKELPSAVAPPRSIADIPSFECNPPPHLVGK